MTISTSGSRTITFSNVQGGAAGAGNIDADPLWASPLDDDYALLPGSPCINTGDENYTHDLDGSLADMGSVPYDPWTELGTGLAGLSGVAQLAGTGSLVGGEPVGLALTAAPGSTPVTLILGASQLGAPFKGGTLWSLPLLVFAGLPTAADGSLTLGSTWPAGFPSGTSFWAQYWWSDAGGPDGVASSNGVRGTQP